MSSLKDAVLGLQKAMIDETIARANGGNSENDGQTQVNLLAIAPSEGEKFRFNDGDSPYAEWELAEKSELCNWIFEAFSKIFCDLKNVSFEWDPTHNQYVFRFMFAFMTDAQFKEIDDGNVTRALKSSYDPNETGNSFAENLLGMLNSDAIQRSDASKYVSFSELAHRHFTDLLVTTKGKKKKWGSDGNVTVQRMVHVGYNGQQFTNLIGVITVDANKTAYLCCTSKKDRENNKFKIIVEPQNPKSNGTDTMLRITRIHNSRKAKCRQLYGIRYTD